jgi:SAM-dependent methyltransferase
MVTAAAAPARPVDRRVVLLDRLGFRPSMYELVRTALDDAISDAESRGSTVDVLDAGCGRVSALRRFRRRIGRLVGADLHPVAPGTLPHLDEFAVVDLCATSPAAFPAASFDVILSSFTIEHFADPPAAFRSFRTWLRPGGALVATTVNRRHPFVALYLGLPARIRHWLQPAVKASAADAHPIVGACNDPLELERALRAAGFSTVEVTLVPHLGRAWGRTWPTFLVGLAGDLIVRAFPSRRSTIVAVARA